MTNFNRSNTTTTVSSNIISRSPPSKDEEMATSGGGGSTLNQQLPLILNHESNILGEKSVKAFSGVWMRRLGSIFSFIPRIFRNLLRMCGIKAKYLTFLDKLPSRNLIISVLAVIGLIFMILIAVQSNKPKGLIPLVRDDNRLVGYIVKTNTNPSFYMRVLNPARDTGFSKHMVRYGNWESATEELFKMLIEKFQRDSKITGKKCLIVDVGSHLGFYSIYPALLGCKVISYEIQPKMVEVIKSSASLNDVDKLVSVKNLAVFRDARKYIQYSTKYNADLTNVVTADEETESKTPGSVETISLDEDYFSADIHINLLKVDISKKSDDVFAGGLRTLSFMIDHIITELTADDAVPIRYILNAYYDKVVVLEDSSGISGLFFKSSTPKIFRGSEVSVEAITAYLGKTGKRNVWFSRKKNTIPYYGK
ncbi:predicted protein [Naegleria gruberi]|uniref:Predicted protein n=1 Tax=Naegleria gruberi TaxID=5762 RepID=D2W4X6_NAEGR|nr:uncharacterized protein NAEGRDRAFT_76463 [Naegleria gruberi]EFC35881.1 predicted protein [Naegleria gruberi]|eukprot:XP_002668625.1 predicted protein [Naegleria gruberi strain NEG-M]